MPTTYDERMSIWRLRHIHGIKPKAIHTLFSHIPHPSIKRICSTFNPETSQKPDSTPTLSQQQQQKQKQQRKDDLIVYEQTTTNVDRVQNLEELILAMNIDLDRWKIDHWTANTWEQAMRGEENLPIITTLYQVKAFLKPHQQALVDTLLEGIREELRDGIPPYKPAPKSIKRPVQTDNRMLEIAVPDMHFGKMALGEETGQPYNIHIAERIYRNSIKRLLESVNGPIDQILFPIGNDLFNVDNEYLTTYANTPQENSHSLKQVYRQVKNIIRDTIIDLAKIAKVDVIVVPGNHDKTLSYFLGETIEDMFWSDKNVIVDNSPTNTKYYQWGRVMLGFAHGQIEKPAQLPMIMANDQPIMWADTQFREWHLGHYHRKRDQVFMPLSHNNGVMVRILPSLTAADNWHKDHGYHMGPRSAEAYLWDSYTGLVATYNCNLVD